MARTVRHVSSLCPPPDLMCVPVSYQISSHESDEEERARRPYPRVAPMAKRGNVPLTCHLCSRPRVSVIDVVKEIHLDAAYVATCSKHADAILAAYNEGLPRVVLALF